MEMPAAVAVRVSICATGKVSGSERGCSKHGTMRIEDDVTVDSLCPEWPILEPMEFACSHDAVVVTGSPRSALK